MLSSIGKTAPHHGRKRLLIFLPVRCVFKYQASTSSKHLLHPFPFPSYANPTPHDIFHLPRSASQDEIKARYYELVKLYHPDAICGQNNVSPSVRNARFRAITHAYGVLRGRGLGSSSEGGVGTWGYAQSRDEAIRAELWRRSRRSRSSSTTMASSGVRHSNIDDAQLRHTLVAFVLAGMIIAMSSVSSHMGRAEQHSKSASANLAQARVEAQVYGMERRRKIRERVRGFHGDRETANGSEPPEMHDASRVRQSESSRGRQDIKKVSNNG